MRRGTALVFLPLVLAACSGGKHGTALEVEFSVSGYQGATEIAMMLSCDPPSGNVAAAAASCAAVRGRRRALFPPEKDVLCIGGIFYVDVAVRGTVDGKRMDRSYGHCGDGRPILAWMHAMRLTLVNITIVSDGRTRDLTLGCAPDLGNVVDHRRACRSLARAPGLLTRPTRPSGRCRRSVHVWGTYRGESIDRRVRCSEPRRVRRWIELALGFYTPPPDRLRPAGKPG